MALSSSLMIFVLVLLCVAHLSLAQDAESALLLGGKSSSPWEIPAATWENAIAQPNATYAIGIAGPEMALGESKFRKDAWNIDIAVTADISLAGSANTSVNQSLVFTGTQLNFVPTATTTVLPGTKWEACIIIGLPGFKSNDSKSIGPFGIGGYNEGFCNFLSLSCQNDLEAAIMDALKGSEFPSCAVAGSITIPDSCGDSISWDQLYVLSVNQSTAIKGGVLFEYGDLPHAMGNLTAYGEAVNKIWGILSAWILTTFEPDGTNSSLVMGPDLNCVQANTIAQGSYDPESSIGASPNYPVTYLLVSVVCAIVAAFMIS